MSKKETLEQSIRLLESGITNSMSMINTLRETKNPKLSPEMIANLMLQTTMNTTAIMDGMRALLLSESNKDN